MIIYYTGTKENVGSIGDHHLNKKDASIHKHSTVFRNSSLKCNFILKEKLLIVPAENKQSMSDTSITLPWSAISLIGFFPVDMYRL